MTLADHPTTTPPPATYGAVLGSRHVVRLLGGTLTGRLPNGMVPVSLVLWITGGGGSLAFAGLLAALYGLASGLSQPIKGRLMDRYGQTRVSAPAVLLNSGCLAALPWIGAGGHPAVVTAVVGFAGLVTAPLESGLRALWPTVVPDLGQRRVVQALDTGSQGLLYIAGPLLASWLSTTHGPDTALTATAALGLLGTMIVLTAAPSRTWRPVTADGAAGSGRLIGAGLVLLCTALAGTGFALGAMTVWAAGMATAHGLAMLSGVLPAAFSTGSFLGGLIYARRTWPGTTTTQLITTSTLFLFGWVPLLAQPEPRAAIALAVIPGLFLTLIITNGFHTVDSLAPASRTTEAYAWLILSVGTGQAAGTALAGALAEHPYVLAGLPAAGAATSLTILTLARRKLGPGRRLGRHRRPRQTQPQLSIPRRRFTHGRTNRMEDRPQLWTRNHPGPVGPSRRQAGRIRPLARRAGLHRLLEGRPRLRHRRQGGMARRQARRGAAGCARLGGAVRHAVAGGPGAGSGLGRTFPLSAGDHRIHRPRRRRLLGRGGLVRSGGEDPYGHPGRLVDRPARCRGNGPSRAAGRGHGR